MKNLAGAWEFVHPEIDDSVEVGTVEVLVGRVHYRGRGSGLEAKSPAGWVLKFRARKVLLFRAFQDLERVLEAVGLIE